MLFGRVLLFLVGLVLTQVQEAQEAPASTEGLVETAADQEVGASGADDVPLIAASDEATDTESLTVKDFENAVIFDEILENMTEEERTTTNDAAMANIQEPSTPTDGKTNRIVPREAVKRWPNAIVPYTMEGNGAFDDEFKALIASAIKEVGDKTCVKWIPKVASDKNWVHIKSTGTSGCVGTLAYNEWLGEHSLELMGGNDKSVEGCRNKGVIIHEMMHNLGFSHEHTRPDRDDKLTVTWPNLPLDKASQHWKTSWVTDPTNVPKCKVEGQVQSTADFSNCVGGSIVEDFGVGYDYNSIMHYGMTLFGIKGADGNPKTVLTPKDTSITKLGSYALTDKDVLKIKKAYGCDGSCGARQKSDTGGDLTGSGSDAGSPCEWIVETTPGKGIEIAISELSGATSDCSTNYLEVRLGDNNRRDNNGAKIEAPLVGKYCSTAGTVKFNNFKIWVKWVRPTASLATSTLKAKWTTFAVACCDKMFIKGKGVYVKQTNTVKDYPVYKAEKENGNDYIFFINYGWRVSASLPKADSTYSMSYQSEGLEYCPDEVTSSWQELKSSAWTLISDKKFVRCSDCVNFPTAEECVSCCDKIIVENLRDSGTYIKQTGAVANYPFYKAEKSNTYMIYNLGAWRVTDTLPTSPSQGASSGLKNLGTEYCPAKAAAQWQELTGSGWTPSTTGKVRCSDCAKYPSAEECVTCCDELTSTYTDLGTNTGWIGQAGNDWKMFQTDANGYKVYKSTADARFCVYVNPQNNWVLNGCDDMTTSSSYGYAALKKCARLTTGWKFVKSGAWVVTDLKFACKGGNPVPPTAAPTLAPATAAPTVAPPTVAPTVAPLPTSKAPAVQCLPCKTVSSGPAELQGTYTLDTGNTQATRTDCKDSCVYKKGAEPFCFAAGGYPVEPAC